MKNRSLWKKKNGVVAVTSTSKGMMILDCRVVRGGLWRTLKVNLVFKVLIKPWVFKILFKDTFKRHLSFCKEPLFLDLLSELYFLLITELLGEGYYIHVTCLACIICMCILSFYCFAERLLPNPFLYRNLSKLAWD